MPNVTAPTGYGSKFLMRISKEKFFSTCYRNKNIPLIVLAPQPNNLKPIVHYLRFNSEIPFEFNPGNRQYTIKTPQIELTMPYVLTLRLNRFLKGIASPTCYQLIDWYKNLPKEEKQLVCCNLIKDQVG